MEAVQYKCPNCGGELQFKPENQNFGCDYCLSSFTEEEIKAVCAKAENSIPADDGRAEVEKEFSEHTNIYHCGSCGAEIMCDENRTADFCYYCHEPVILSGKMSGDFTPNKVIGFKLTRDDAVNLFKKWCGKRWFVPSGFKSNKQLEKLTGLYVPFWVADCGMKVDYSASAQKRRSWTSDGYRYTEIKEYEIIRKADISAEGIPADGESKIDDLLMESIEPFDYSQAKDFSMSYLSGFYADKYDVDKAAVFPRIKNRAADAARNVINQSISGYTTVVPRYEDYKILNTDWQYMLLPVWFMTYKYNGQIYSFAVNGQTGKLAGTPPLDKFKLLLASLGAGLLTALIVFLIMGVL